MSKITRFSARYLFPFSSVQVSWFYCVNILWTNDDEIARSWHWKSCRKRMGKKRGFSTALSDGEDEELGQSFKPYPFRFSPQVLSLGEPTAHVVLAFNPVAQQSRPIPIVRLSCKFVYVVQPKGGLVHSVLAQPDSPCFPSMSHVNISQP